MSGNERARILVLTTNFPRYMRGDTTGTFVYDIADALSDDFEMTVIAPHDNESTQGDEVMGEGIRVRRFHYFWPRRFQRLAYGDGLPENFRRSWLARLQFPFLFLAMCWAVLRNASNCDLIHCHWSFTALAALPAKFLFRKRIVLTVHGADVRMFPDFLTRFIVSRVDCVISAHEDLLEKLRSLGQSEKLQNVRNLVTADGFSNGASIEQELKLASSEIVLFVGRLAPMKDPLTLIEAVPYVLRERPHTQFVIAGDGPLAPDVRRRIEELGVECSVHMLGHRTDVKDLLSVARMFVALSPEENIWSTTIIEAMKGNVPCVVTTAGKSADMLRHRKEAYLIPPKTPDVLALAILDLMDHPEDVDSIVAGSHRLLEREGFSDEVVLTRMRSIYSTYAL